MNSKESSVIYKTSKFISNFFNPLVSLLASFIGFSIKNYTFIKTLEYFAPLLFLLILPIIFWIKYNVKTGKYSNYDVSDQKQRRSLYWFILLCFCIYMLYYGLVYAKIDFMVLFVIFLLFVLQMSNVYIKSSMHTAFNVLAAAFFYEIDEKWGFIWLGIALLVGMSRIILKRHSPKEVFMGFGLAILVSFCYLYTNIN